MNRSTNRGYLPSALHCLWFAAAAYHETGPCGEMQQPFSWKRMGGIYGSYSNIQAKLDAAVDRDVEQLWVPKAYAARMKAGHINMPTMELTKKPSPGKLPGEAGIRVLIVHANQEERR